MTELQTKINEFMVKADQVLPAHPTIPDEHTCILRMRLIAEELMELADGMGFRIQLDSHAWSDDPKVPGKTRYALELSKWYRKKPDLVEIADAFSDLNYVNIGGQSAFGIDGEPCDLEVHESNMSKFIDGHKDEHGKWIKGPSTRQPDLAPILRAQGAEL